MRNFGLFGSKISSRTTVVEKALGGRKHAGHIRFCHRTNYFAIDTTQLSYNSRDPHVAGARVFQSASQSGTTLLHIGDPARAANNSLAATGAMTQVFAYEEHKP